jgi:hypothetical protein
MRLLNYIIIKSLGIFIVYLAFVKDITIFQVLLYITLGLAAIGVFLDGTYENISKYKWYQFVLAIPSSIICWWIGLNYGGETYAYLSIILNVVLYTVILNKKAGRTIN